MMNISQAESDIKTNSQCRPATKKYSRVFPESDDDEVVISGMSGKFPNSHNIAEYEYHLYNKVDMVDDDERRWRHFSNEIPKRSGKIFDLEKFDATFFGVHFKQAHTLDPQSRLLMETAYEAVLDAGINPKTLRGSRTGVFVGSCISESEKTWFYERPSPGGFGITGCSRAMLANRISYSLGLQGPSFLVDTACSSSMYALDNAFNMLRNGEIDAAIVGGANLTLHPNVTLQFARLGVLAADGYCRPFDKKASGYTRSEAITCLFLQKKVDAKRVYAHVVYSKTNCDGFKPEGITFPSGKQQEALLREFYTEVNISPNELGFLEAHSTGTVVGDPEECRAIDNVICSQRDKPLLVGSVKSNVGHSESASGISSLIKACFAFETGKIPPNINFDELKPEIPALAEGRLKVVENVTDLKKPYIGVNSFGFGGANAHVLLKANDISKLNMGVPSDEIPRLVPWSGRTEDSVNGLMNYIEKTPIDAEFIALLHNVQNEDTPGMVFRGYGIFKKNGSMQTKTVARGLKHYSGVKRPIVWVFSGMGSQWSSMGSSLLAMPRFRHSIEMCHKVLQPKGIDLFDILTSKNSTLFDNILNSFVGIAAVQIALVDVLHDLNLTPDYIIGHSVGELGCGYADGGLSLEQMILAAYFRGKVSQELEKIKGAMAAVGLGYKDIVGILPSSIEVACHNSANSCTISGPFDEVCQFVIELKKKNIFAKEVQCSNIPYHSRYISHMGPHLLRYLKQTISCPKVRSKRWLSSSVPRAKWDNPVNNLCSADYLTNNLLSSVLFEETFAYLPKNSMTIEVAPHGLLQGILRHSMPEGTHIPLTQRENTNNLDFFLTALGKVYCEGIPLSFARLYPEVTFPVSKGTKGISSFVLWDHSENWFVTKYENMKTKSSGERTFKVNLTGEEEEEFMAGHIIDGKILIPATCYLQYVWETFSFMYHGPSFMNVPIEFDDIRFIRATHMTPNKDIELTVMIHYGTGSFEITELGSLVMTGTVREMKNPKSLSSMSISNKVERPSMLCKRDFYKELKLRGYHYSGGFKSVFQASCDGLYGKVEWAYNWVTFMDAMLQVQLIGADTRSLLLPTKIRKISINGPQHFDLASKLDPLSPYFEVFVDKNSGSIVAGGIEIIGLNASPVRRRKSPGLLVRETYKFQSHFPSQGLLSADAARLLVQLRLEFKNSLMLKVVEVGTDGKDPIIQNFTKAIEDFPTILGEFLYLTEKEIDDIPGVRCVKGNFLSQKNCDIFIYCGIFSDLENDICETAKKCVAVTGYIIMRTNTQEELPGHAILDGFENVAVFSLNDIGDTLYVFRRRINQLSIDPVVIEISEKDTGFAWITEMQSALSQKQKIVAYSYNENFNGSIGLVNCLRREPGGDNVTLFFINDISSPKFSLTDPLYSRQYERGLPINVYQNGQWGTYRHFPLRPDSQSKPRNNHIYANVASTGDLTSLRWFEGSITQNESKVKIIISSLNFRDVMLATGRLGMEIFGESRLDQGCALGLEYSGIDLSTGDRIMSMALRGAVATYTNKTSSLVWKVPNNWTLEEAATVPVVYITVYYAFFICTDIRKGKSILIHAGTGGIGLAAIRVALSYNMEVYTTCSNSEKKSFLLTKFPQLKESNIASSRNTSFEDMIYKQTRGKGVDFVLNSLSEEMLLASVRCLGFGGHFLEIGKFDMANDNKLGMGCFLKEITFHSVMADRLFNATAEKIESIKKLIDDGLAQGTIQPLPFTIFKATEVEMAFRHLMGGKHIGKVLVKVHEHPNAEMTLPLCVEKQVHFNSSLSYIIVGGLGGFGLELADWMIIRGARKLVLSSSQGITRSYQSYRINLWKTYHCQVQVSTHDITTEKGCRALLKDGEKLGPIGGIFNLAVKLRDGIFANQTENSFKECFGPKAAATRYLDQLSRTLCPKLEHFVVFSSISCGRGNPGQSNYGMANSVMERIVENRILKGLPGKAIQWGAIGDVGLVAEMSEEKINIEIGGTLQQRISSCLQELDNLLTTPDAIVASMVVAEKRACNEDKESIIKSVMKIMGIRDLKSISLTSTLSEMGMDSLMAVELQQTLERNFELFLTPQDLRSLTFEKVLELERTRESPREENTNIVETQRKGMFGIEQLLRNLGDEENCHEILLPLQTAVDVRKQQESPIIIIPGLEGTAGLAWYKIGKFLNKQAFVLQLHTYFNFNTTQEIVEACFEHVTNVLKNDKSFYIIGYSYGSIIAICLSSLLEKAGFQGQLLLIDGAPHFLKKLTTVGLGDKITEDELRKRIFEGIVHHIFPNQEKDLNELNNVNEKIQKLIEYVAKKKFYSSEYAEKTLHAIFKRIIMVYGYDLQSIEKIKSPIALIRPAEVALQEIEEDYCISKITEGKTMLKVIEGSHTTMLDNPILPQLINDIDCWTDVASVVR